MNKQQPNLDGYGPELQVLQQARQEFIDAPPAHKKASWDNLQAALRTYNQWGNTPINT